MLQEADDVETEFHREMAPDTIEEAFFNFASLNSRQFLAIIKETYALARLPDQDTLAIQVLLRTRARVKRDIIPQTRSAAAEKEHLEQQLQKMGETEMSLRARLSVYEEQFQEMHDFKSRYYELKSRLDAQASQTLEDSAPRVVPLSQELSETREASATLLREREDAEYRLEQAQEQIQRLTEQKTKHENELVQLRKHIEASQQMGQNQHAAAMQWPSASPVQMPAFLTPQAIAAPGGTPGFLTGSGMQYTTLQQPNEWGLSPPLPLISKAAHDSDKQKRIMEALKSPEYGVVSEGDRKAAETRVNALAALHALRSQVRDHYSLPGRLAAPLSVKERANMLAEVTRIAQAQNANLARLIARNKHLTHSDVLSCTRDILAELHIKWPRHMLMEAFKK